MSPSVDLSLLKDVDRGQYDIHAHFQADLAFR